LTDAFRFG
jgi:hypothetical protein